MSLWDWSKLVRLSDAELGNLDVAGVHLACAVGLPGAESLDIAACLRTLDRWAQQVGRETQRLAYIFDQRPDAYEHSFPRFQVEVLVTILQRDLGVHYRQELIDMDDARFFTRADHLFLHGVVQGKSGSCSSLPPLYVAVGRRLGYPLKLVQTKRHIFARWDEPGSERFNIECTSRGLNIYPDNYYLQWPLSTTADEVELFGYLQSLTPRRELAMFLGSRGVCWETNKQWGNAIDAYAEVCELEAGSPDLLDPLVHAMNAWDRELRAQLMPGFPSMAIAWPPRRYPALPLDIEKGIFHMKAKEHLLTHPVFKRDWWDPLRRNPSVRPPLLPAHVTLRYGQTPGELNHVTFHAKVPAYFDPSNVSPA